MKKPEAVSPHTIAGSVPRCPACGGQIYDCRSHRNARNETEVDAMTCAGCGHNILSEYWGARPRTSYALKLPRVDVSPWLWIACGVVVVALIFIMQPTYSFGPSGALRGD